MTSDEIAQMTGVLAPELVGRRIHRIDQPDKWTISFDLRCAARRVFLRFCVQPGYCRFHLSGRKARTDSPPSSLLQVLRTHWTGAKITSLEQQAGDRAVILKAEKRDKLLVLKHYSFIVELTGVHGNFFFVSEASRILGLLRPQRTSKRALRSGKDYEPMPPATYSGPPINRFASEAEKGDFFELSLAVERHYDQLTRADDAVRKKHEMSSHLNRKRRQLQKLYASLSSSLKEASEVELLRKKGELLQSIMHTIKRGAGSVTTADLFDPEQRDVKIELNPALTPLQNVERYFKRYKKLKSARTGLEDRLKSTRDELSAVEEATTSLENASSPDAVMVQEQELKEKGMLQERKAPAAQREPAKGPRRFVSSDGLEILVARNRRQNDELTFKIARGNDLWLHLSDWPGPHVAVRLKHTGDIPQETILDAAHLAVHFSKIRGANHAEIVYTYRKNVHRARGREPGLVNYSDAKHLTLRIEPPRLARLLDRKEH